MYESVNNDRVTSIKENRSYWIEYKSDLVTRKEI